MLVRVERLYNHDEQGVLLFSKPIGESVWASLKYGFRL